MANIPSITLKPHQQQAVDKLQNGQILVGGVGSGKSFASLFYFYTRVMGGTPGDMGSIKNPMNLYVITTARKRDTLDWERDALVLDIPRNSSASLHGISITVDSYNNLAKYKDVTDAFFIFDEQKLVGSGAWSKSFIHIAKRNKWILLSATPGDTWIDYIPVFIANGFYKNRTEFKREHVIEQMVGGRYPKIVGYRGVSRLVKARNKVLLHMPYERHTTRHIEMVEVDHDVEMFEKVAKKRWHVYEERPVREVSELFSVMRKVVNSDRSRIRALSKLLETHPKVIVFYNFDYELKMLRESLSNGLDTQTSLVSTFRPTTTSDLTSLNSEMETESPSSDLSGQSTLLRTNSSGTNRPSLRLTGSEPSDLSLSQHPSTTSLCESKNSIKSFTGGLKVNDAQQKTMSKTLLSDSSLLRESNSPKHSNLAVAEWNGHKHEPIPDTDRWVYLVQYMAGAEAWNCIETNAVVFYSLNYSYKMFEQCQGRIDRLNTPFKDLYYYVFRSKSWIDMAIWKALRMKENFNESAFKFRKVA